MEFTRSSFCRTDTPMCLEVADLDAEYIHVRNSQVPHTIATFTRDEWVAFLDGAKAGEFDLRTWPEADAGEGDEES